jgi:hypothetical protein
MVEGVTVDLAYETERQGGVTFVSATVTNPMTTPQVVRLQNRLDGPVWPPREGRTTAPAWDDGTWRATLAPGETRGLGYASPAEPVEEPLAVRSVQRAASGGARQDPSTVLAGLDDWMPPRTAVDR